MRFHDCWKKQRLSNLWWRERERQRREGSAGDSSVQSALTVYFIAFSRK